MNKYFFAETLRILGILLIFVVHFDIFNLMKTKKQVEHFLARRKYSSAIDFEGISLYCKNKFNIKLHTPSSYFPENALDYSTFAYWLEHGYGAGDVVIWDENLCLVDAGDVNEVHICFKIDSNGVNFDSFTLNEQVISHASKNAADSLYLRLREIGKEFGNPFFCITEKFIPSPGSIVTFQNHKTGQEGVGVVRLVKITGEVVMYCYLLKGLECGVRYGMNEYLGMSGDISFQPVQPADYPRKALEKALNDVGKTWNHNLKRIEPVDMKAEKGGVYFYITDQRTVVRAVEKGTPTSHKRYLAGNYFKSEEDANRINEEENELRRNYLAEPKKSLE